MHWGKLWLMILGTSLINIPLRQSWFVHSMELVIILVKSKAWFSWSKHFCPSSSWYLESTFIYDTSFMELYESWNPLTFHVLPAILDIMCVSFPAHDTSAWVSIPKMLLHPLSFSSLYELPTLVCDIVSLISTDKHMYFRSSHVLAPRSCQKIIVRNRYVGRR